jgi:hypothetical protein
MNSGKQHAHELIERLDTFQIPTAVSFLEFMMLDPVARAVATAPPDEEPVTGQDRRRFHDGQAWSISNRKIFHPRRTTFTNAALRHRVAR